ncbi:MAG: repair protein RecN, partial [Chloroflexota bacterium]
MSGRLLELAVADLALIERLRLELAPGLNVITGETGAGKSLLIDALGLAVGSRADTSLVRHGREQARVEALFERLPEPLICVREVSASGRSTARVDDETVTAARLAEVAGPLVEIHGQHEQQRLLDERWQRDVVDTYGGHRTERERVADAVGRWRANRAALAELEIDPRELERRLGVLEHEAAEIAAARLVPGEAAAIRTRLEAARHGETIARGSGAIHEALVGEAGSAREAVAAAAHAARELARVDPRFDELAARLAGLEAEIVDAGSSVRSLGEDLDHDPGTLATLEERISLIYSLERRYGEDEATVLAYGERAAAEAERLRDLEVERERRRAAERELLAEVASAAGALSALRRTTAERLTGAVSDALGALGFPAGVFVVSVAVRPPGGSDAVVDVDGTAAAFDETGMDQVLFLIAPNQGEPARPLARIASGGELSRVALALKEVLAAADETPTLVFDEVDTGIGGRSAEPVGRSLWSLARRHQVLCV